MKSYLKLTLLAIVAFSFALSSCNDSYKTPEIEGLAVYTDAVNNMSVKYPKNWKVIESHVKGTRSVTFAPEGPASMLKKYQDYSVEALPGAYIKLMSFGLDSAHNFEYKVDKHRKQLKDVVTYKEQSYNFGGNPEGIMMTYAFPLNHVEDTMRGFRYFAATDSLTGTFLLIDTYVDTYGEYKEYLDEIVKSVKLAETVIEVPKDSSIFVQDTFAFPTTELLTTIKGNGFDLGVPMHCRKEKTEANIVHITADRRMDCGITVKFTKSESTDLKKQATADNNKKTVFGGKSPKSTKLGGLEAYEATYKVAGVTRTAWMVIHNGNLYTIFKDIPGEDFDKYKPAMDKAVSTLKFK